MFDRDVSSCRGAVMLPLLRKCRTVAVALEAARKKRRGSWQSLAIKVCLVHAMSVKLLRGRHVRAASIDFGLMSPSLLRCKALQICRGSSQVRSMRRRDHHAPWAARPRIAYGCLE
jgi:hypothetical protein